MVIITNYELVVNLDGEIICQSHEAATCPHCQSALKHRDCRLRVIKFEGGEKAWILINRLYCSKCHMLHTELPDCLVPYKHYASEIIEGVLDDIVTSEDEDSEDYPCDMTMQRWKKWIEINKEYIEGCIRRIRHNIFSEEFSLLKSLSGCFDAIRSNGKYWLAIIVRLIYNNGDTLATESPPKPPWGLAPTLF